MKKYLLSLLALFSLQAMAMVEETATFEFKQPLNLNLDPPFSQIDLNQFSDPDASGVLANISNKTITSGPIVISFTRPTNTPGAGISRYGGAGGLFCLEMGRLVEVNFNATAGCVLKSITFDQDSELILPSDQPGSWNYTTNTWSASDNSTSSVTLKNGDQGARIYVITVKYLRPSATMNFVSSSPAQGATVTGSFQTMTMSFSSAVAKVNNASNIKLTGTDVDNTPIDQSMSATISGSTVSLSIPTAIAKDASLTVTAPAGTFENAEGVTNQQAITVSFTLLSQGDDGPGGGGTSGDGDFRYTFDAYITFLPASVYRTSGYFKDIDLNDMYVYVYESMASGLVPDPEKQVSVVTNHGAVATTGHFEVYDDFAKDFSQYLGDLTGTFALKFIPDVPIKEGDLDNWSGYYTYRCEPATFGDANFGRWLADHDSVNPEDCRVNPALDIGSVLVYNSRVDDPELSKCATPTISVIDGKLHFECETPGVTFHYGYTFNGSTTVQNTGNDIPLSSSYNVWVIAKKSGYNDSDRATKQIDISGDVSGLQGDVNHDGKVSISDAVGIVNIIMNGGEGTAAPALSEPD